MTESAQPPPRKKKNVVAAAAVGLVIAAAAGGMWIFTSPDHRRGYPIEPTGQPVTADTNVGLGAYLQVERDGDWYEATVQELHDDGTFGVHYDGWDSRYDEDVTRDRMRLAPVPDVGDAN